MQYEPLKEVREQPVHYTSQHPPLYYVILAPFLAPFLEDGDWKRAMLTGRIINIAIGVLLGAALAWAGWEFGGRRRYLFVISVPFIGLMALVVARASGDVVNDILGMLWVVLALTLTYRLVRDGVDTRSLLLLSAVLALGMSTRASFIATFGISLVAVAASIFIHVNKIDLAVKSLRGIQASLYLIVPALLAVGWFYWRNYQASGSWARSGPQSWISDIRPYKSLLEVLTSPDLYKAPKQMFHAGRLWYISAVSFLAGVFVLIPVVVRNFKKSKKITGAVVFLTAVYVLLVYGMQIEHAVGYGQFSARYFLPLLMPISVVVVYGLAYFEKLKGMAIVAFVGLSLAGFIAGTKNFLETKVNPSLYKDLGYIDTFREASVQNGVPFVAVVVCTILCLIGFVLVAISLYKVSSRNISQPYRKILQHR